MSVILIIFQFFHLGAINRRRDRENPKPEDYTPEMKALEVDKGDRATFFRYAL